jgi:uncharacterized protein
MKRIFLVLGFIALCLFLYWYSTKRTKEEKVLVFDYQHELTREQANKFDSLFKLHEIKTDNEIALVITDNYGSDKNILFYSVNFGRQNGIGKKDKNNGIVIVFNNKKQEINISTGYGTEKVLKDEIAKKIVDSLMIPNFKQGKNFNGLWEGSKAIVDFLERPENKIN